MILQRWRAKWLMFMGILWLIVIWGQWNGVGSELLRDAEPTMSQAVHEVWSMIALVGIMILTLLQPPQGGE